MRSVFELGNLEATMARNKKTKEQIEFAKDLITYFEHSGCLDRDRDWVQAWYTFHLRWSDKIPEINTDPGKPSFIAIPDKFVVDFVERARSSRSVLDLLMFLIGTRFQAGVNIPDSMVALAGEYLVHGLKFKESNKPPRNWGRDYLVYHVMRDLTFRFDISPTKGSDQRGQRDTTNSASQIISWAIAESELPTVSVDLAQKIWSAEQARNKEESDEMPSYSPALHFVEKFDDPKDWVWV